MKLTLNSLSTVCTSESTAAETPVVTPGRLALATVSAGIGVAGVNWNNNTPVGTPERLALCTVSAGIRVAGVNWNNTIRGINTLSLCMRLL